VVPIVQPVSTPDQSPRLDVKSGVNPPVDSLVIDVRFDSGLVNHSAASVSPATGDLCLAGNAFILLHLHDKALAAGNPELRTHSSKSCFGGSKSQHTSIERPAKWLLQPTSSLQQKTNK
jgi:hypothetical protein